jgi:signal-transduction protein with cAMP-binding, CBS, and nucleotidyltransferase domain
MREYHPLNSFFPAQNGTCTLAQPMPNKATALDSPASEVMTDLTQVAAIAIEGTASLVVANDTMIARGVRSLFVTSGDGRVTGLITTTDLLGDRPIRVSQARGVRRGELQVLDVMTPIDAVVALKLEDVRAAKVGHIVASLKAAGRHHELVAETLASGKVQICGIFSASQIARQLGAPLQISELAQTFAEVEQALVASK